MSELNKDPYDLFELFGLPNNQVSNNSNKSKPMTIKKKIIVKKKKIKNNDNKENDPDNDSEYDTGNYSSNDNYNDPGNDGDNESISNNKKSNYKTVPKNNNKTKNKIIKKSKAKIMPKINEESSDENQSELEYDVSNDDEQKPNKSKPIKINQDKQYIKKVEISKPINYLQEEELMNKKANKALIQMKNGTRVFKCTSSGAPHFRTIKLAQDNSHIYWYPDEGDEDTGVFWFFTKNPEDRILHVNDINTVVLGQNTKKFYEAKFSLYSNTSLSIVYSNNYKTLDLIFPIKEDFENWLLGLRFLRKNI